MRRHLVREIKEREREIERDRERERDGTQLKPHALVIPLFQPTALFEKIERLETKICHQNEIMDLACPSEISVV